MKSKYYIIHIIIILILLLSSCSNELNELRKELSDKEKIILELQQEINRLNSMLQEQKPISLFFISSDIKRRFVENEIPMFLYPAEAAPEINRIHENSIVDVHDMVAVRDEIWIYVEKYITPDPHNIKGWIRLTDTVPYTEEKQPLVQTYVEVAEGTLVYETYDFSQVPHMSPVLSYYRERGRLFQEQNSYVSIDIPGGKTVIVEKKYLIYPEVLDDEDTESFLNFR